jgi:hypothetical protein
VAGRPGTTSRRDSITPDDSIDRRPCRAPRSRGRGNRRSRVVFPTSRVRH